VGLGTDIRLSRLFAHPSGTLFGIAVDHFVGYGNVREGGLSDLPSAVEQCMRAHPDTMTMTPGTAKHCWPPYVGQASLIVQASYWTPDDRIRDRLATPADAVRLGADALAVAIGVRGETEGDFIRWLSDAVRDAAAYELPVVAHIYPRDYSDGVKIVFTPDEIAYAVRAGKPIPKGKAEGISAGVQAAERAVDAHLTVAKEAEQRLLQVLDDHYSEVEAAAELHAHTVTQRLLNAIGEVVDSRWSRTPHLTNPKTVGQVSNRLTTRLASGGSTPPSRTHPAVGSGPYLTS